MWLAIGPSFGWWMFGDRAPTRPDGHFQYTRWRNVRPTKIPKNPANTMGTFFIGAGRCPGHFADRGAESGRRTRNQAPRPNTTSWRATPAPGPSRLLKKPGRLN